MVNDTTIQARFDLARGRFSFEASRLRTNDLAWRTAFWAAVALVVLGVAYAAGLALMLFALPPLEWKGIQDYAAQYQTPREFVYQGMQWAAFLSLPAFGALVAGLHELAPPEKKLLARLALMSAVVFISQAGLNYYVQLTALRQNILHGQLDGLALFAQANPSSAMAAATFLAWGLFQGLATLCLAPLFGGERLTNLIRWLLVVNALASLVGAFSYAAEAWGVLLLWLLVITIVEPIMYALMAWWFRRVQPAPAG